MSQANFELVALKNGQRSIRSRAHGETMHIGTGPRTEALELHINQQRLVERVQARNPSEAAPFVIWDVGLGPAGNALTTIDALSQVIAPVEIHSFETSTEVLEFALQNASGLDYLTGWESAIGTLLSDHVAFPVPHIRWQLHRGDFRERLHDGPPPSAIFHDPYSPAQNPDMWGLEMFRATWMRVSGTDASPCTMTNYTRSTAVRVTMALAGWFVGIGVPTGEKDQTTIAANCSDLLERPLDRAWLARVRVSTNAAPFRNGVYAPGPISAEDYAALAALPQFA